MRLTAGLKIYSPQRSANNFCNKALNVECREIIGVVCWCEAGLQRHVIFTSNVTTASYCHWEVDIKPAQPSLT